MEPSESADRRTSSAASFAAAVVRGPSPILVTGAHRTGTTWVGKMLSASGEAGYISEPFNLLHRPGVMRARVRVWYPYICNENEAGLLLAMQDMLSFHYHPWLEVRSLRSTHDTLRFARDWRDFSAARRQKRIPLVKDPFAVFSIPWLIERLNFRVVVTVRHPAAFASSLKRLEWPFELEDLLEQPLLVRDWLGPFQEEMRALANADRDRTDIVGRASLLWRVVYATIDALRSLYPQIHIVLHEDLSLNPLNGFSDLYHDLGLAFTPQTSHVVQESSSSENPREASTKDIYATRLDSQASLSNWKRRLTPDEILKVKRLTAGISEMYYPDQTWE